MVVALLAVVLVVVGEGLVVVGRLVVVGGLVVEAVVTAATTECAVPAGESCPTWTHTVKPIVIKTFESMLRGWSL